MNWSEHLAGQQVTVAGAGRSGRAAAVLAASCGARVRLVEANPQALSAPVRENLQDKGIQVCTGAHTPEHFAGSDLLVLSPGIALSRLSPFCPRDLPVISELELALGQVHTPIIAVTGTNGKTTTVSLIAHILTAMGRSCFLGGNIGTPLSEFVCSGQPVEVLVLEVSSFQLEHTRSLHPRVGVWLNFSENHLDHHADVQEYWQAKRSLFANQQGEDVALIHTSLWPWLQDSDLTRGMVRIFDQEDGFALDQLPGGHNTSNMQAAALACQPWGVTAQDAFQAMRSYSPHPHRLQRVGERQGVLFVNDSKATTVHALQAALDSFQRPIHLLAGGRFKGGDLRSLREQLADKVRSVTLFGQSRESFEQAWSDLCPLTWRAELQAAVEHAAGLAQPGEVVLLSPATSSFDLFADYKERGEVFIQAVQALGGGGQRA